MGIFFFYYKGDIGDEKEGIFLKKGEGERQKA